MHLKLKQALIGLLITFAAVNCSANYTEGVEYTRLPVTMTTSSEPGKIEVIEVFWYMCPHCYTLEAHLNNWQIPDNIDFKLVPAISPKGWAATGARVFYTAVALGVLDKIHTPLFEAIHNDKRTKLGNDPEAIADFFAEHGVDNDKFYDTWHSFFVDSKLASAQQTFVSSGITGVPAVIVNGKYLTSPGKAGGAQNMLRVIEYLANMESAN